MTLDGIKKKVSDYLLSSKRWPIVVDFASRSDMADFIEHFKIGDNQMLSAEKFCGKGGTFKHEELINTIQNNKGNTFILETTAFLKLHGENFTQSILKSVLSKNIDGHLVFITYQCKNYLSFKDNRFGERNQIYLVEGDLDVPADICLIRPELVEVFPGCYNGFQNLGYAYEHKGTDVIYIATDIEASKFSLSVFKIMQMHNSFDILCGKDSRTRTLPKHFGTEEQWNYALKQMGASGNWLSIAEGHFGGVQALTDCILQYDSYNDNKKWLYFIIVSLFGVKKNSYLQFAIEKSACYLELRKELFRALLSIDYQDSEFGRMYDERKRILCAMPDITSEIVDYCKVVNIKGQAAIYYLTDITQIEKERVIDWLAVYGQNYSNAGLIKILKVVYADLSKYLSTYRFKNSLLDKYFENYKYQKVINKLLPSFQVVVEEEAKALNFVSILPARTSVVDKLNLQSAHAYFFDALGVEYLSFIQSKCEEYGLTANISIARCELPSLTCFNKEFVATFNQKGCKVSDIKELDEIKHHGEETFSYEKVKTPIYLIRELEIIDELLKKIQASIYSPTSNYKKIIIISDHGASRLAVLNETENLWKMETKGVHSGRCCPQNEINEQPSSSISAENYWVLSNYDRFQGSRKANVEVHGGATLEEVAVPIIEIEMKATSIEAFILDSYKVVELAAKEYPVIRIYVGVKSQNIAVRIGNIYYDADKTDETYVYEVKLTNCSKKGVYSIDILNGNEVIVENQSFEVKKKGFAINSLFD